MTSRILWLWVWRPFLRSCILIGEAEWAALWKYSPFYHLNYKNNTVQTVKLISKSKLHIETRFPVFPVFIPLNSLDRIGFK